LPPANHNLTASAAKAGVTGKRARFGWVMLQGCEPGEALGIDLAIVYSVSIVAIMASSAIGVCFEFPVPA
jgi:hypothetical protein